MISNIPFHPESLIIIEKCIVEFRDSISFYDWNFFSFKD